ncbi:MAG: type II secretion system protein [Candidatus Sumerlaeaceae bacterium]
MSRKLNRRAFTLIELLMVVAIIVILAAIAIPNFLEAQTRAKVSRAHNDLRAIGTAIESYRVDHNQYPPENWVGAERVSAWGDFFIPNAVRLVRITTPIAYITSLPNDIFDPGTDPLNQLQPHTYHYVAKNDPTRPNEIPFFQGNNPDNMHMEWMMQSYGPDLGRDGGSETYWQYPRYDPTNGTLSIGNILRSGP